MVRTLQRRFVAAAMAAVTILLLILIGAINGLHIVSIRSEEDRMLRMLAENEGVPGHLPSGRQDDPSDDEFEDDYFDDDGPDDDHGIAGYHPGRGFFRTGSITMDNAMAMRYFLVKFDGEDVTVVDTSRIWSVSSEEAKAMALEVRKSGASAGRYDSFRYRAEEDIVVFLDVSMQEETVRSVLLISVLIAVLCWLLTLVIVLLLSRRAIRPVAQNIQRQREFVTNAGHEIKTPLAIIQTNTEALELYNGESKWTRNIKAQVTRLSGLMQDLLTLSRLDEGVKLTLTELDLAQLVRETAENFRENAESRGIGFTLPPVQQKAVVRGDAATLRQLISTLTDNAVRYTPENGKIGMSVSRSGGRTVLQQWNTVEKEQMEEDPSRLFERFYRSDRARTQKSGGYGIGLSAARSIAEANGGTLTASYGRTEEGNDRILFSLRL